MNLAALRVLVIDDHPVVRLGTRRILEAGGLQVVGEAASAEQAIELMDTTPLDVVLADVRLPGMSGIEFAAEAGRRRPAVKVLVLTSYANPSYVNAALAAGAAGFLLKTISDEGLLSAVQAVFLGATVLDPNVSTQLVLTSAAPPHGLTDREQQITGLVARGMVNKQIAAELHVSKRTIDAHLGHLFAKLNVSTRAELVASAARRGLIDE